MVSARLCINYNFCQFLDVKCPRMLDDVELGIVRPIHRDKGAYERDGGDFEEYLL